MAQVVIMMGSASDEEKVSPCVEVLRSLGISYHFTVSSAHRTPERTEKLVRETTAAFLKIPIPAKPVDNTEPRSLSGMALSWLSSTMHRCE